MSGGTISGNSTSGAETLSTAVAITTGKAYISGGSIINNRCGSGSAQGGITIGSAGGQIYLSGNPVISGNQNSAKTVTSNVYLPNSRYLNFDGALTAGANIGIYTATAPTSSAQVKFTSGFSTHNLSSPGTYFKSDRASTNISAQVDIANNGVKEGCIASGTATKTYLSAKPKAVAASTITYDGYWHTLVEGVNIAYMTVTGNSQARAVGTYS